MVEHVQNISKHQTAIAYSMGQWLGTCAANGFTEFIQNLSVQFPQKSFERSQGYPINQSMI